MLADGFSLEFEWQQVSPSLQIFTIPFVWWLVIMIFFGNIAYLKKQFIWKKKKIENELKKQTQF